MHEPRWVMCCSRATAPAQPNKRLKLPAPGLGSNSVRAPTRVLLISLVAAPARVRAPAEAQDVRQLQGGLYVIRDRARCGPRSVPRCLLSVARSPTPELCVGDRAR